jgi:Tfp pilus assembly protein PilP
MWQSHNTSLLLIVLCLNWHACFASDDLDRFILHVKHKMLLSVRHDISLQTVPDYTYSEELVMLDPFARSSDYVVSLEQLYLIGILKHNGQRWGIVRKSRGQVMALAIGDCISGDTHHCVLQINNHAIIIG